MSKQKELSAMLKNRGPVPQEEKKEEVEEEVKEEAQETKSPEPDIKAAFEQHSNRPSQEEVEKWKAEYGNVFVSAFSEEELIVWRPLMREEYRNLQQLIAQAKEPISQADQEEAVADVCVLWPLLETNPAEYQKIFRKAGVFSTLYEQITQASHFVAPGYAGMLVAEL